MILFTVFGESISEFVMLKVIKECSEYFLFIFLELLRTGVLEGLPPGLFYIGIRFLDQFPELFDFLE